MDIPHESVMLIAQSGLNHSEMKLLLTIMALAEFDQPRDRWFLIMDNDDLGEYANMTGHAVAVVKGCLHNKGFINRIRLWNPETGKRETDEIVITIREKTEKIVNIRS